MSSSDGPQSDRSKWSNADFASVERAGSTARIARTAEAILGLMGTKVKQSFRSPRTTRADRLTE